MAGDWIKMRGNLWDDPRIGRICDLTGSKEATAIGALYWLWATADQHTDDGCMPGLSLQQIDRKTGVKGFAAALVDVGWLVDRPEGVRISRFTEHNGRSAKQRSETARRVAKHRSCIDEVTTTEQIGNGESVTGALAREREREEKKEIHSEAIASGAVAPPKPAPEEIIFGYGVPLLVSAGSSDKSARSFLGGLRKTNGDAAVVNALRDCLRAKPLQPLEWLAAALPPAGVGGKQTALERRNAAVAAELGAMNA